MQSNLKPVVTAGSYKISSISILIQRHLVLFTFCNYLKCISRQKETLSKPMSQPQCTTMKTKQNKLLLYIPECFSLFKGCLGALTLFEEIFDTNSFCSLRYLPVWIPSVSGKDYDSAHHPPVQNQLESPFSSPS